MKSFRLRLRAPAKLNLFFEVLGRRPDGYHEIATVTALVSLCDHLLIETFSDSEREVALSCLDMEGNDLSSVIPTDGRNLAVKAYHLLADISGKSTSAEIRLRKQIPSEAGLGGGSSDAAATLAGLNRLWNLNYPAGELAKIGAQLGSDVPLFFEKSPALGSGRGEITSPIGKVKPIDFVIFKPPFGLSTAAVYRALDKGPSSKPRGTGPLTEALRRGADARQLAPLFFNRLEETAREICPDLDSFFEVLGGDAPFRLTGSGTALYAPADSAEQAAALKDKIEKKGIPGKVFVCRSTASPLSHLSDYDILLG